MIEPKSSFPVFIVKDLGAAKSFYTENLGFDVVFSGDWYIHLVSSTGVQVGFMLPEQPTQPPRKYITQPIPEKTAIITYQSQNRPKKTDHKNLYAIPGNICCSPP